MALRLKGIASNDHIAEITGKGQAEVDDVLNMMQENHMHKRPQEDFASCPRERMDRRPIG